MSWFMLLPPLVVGLLVLRVVRTRQFAREWAKKNGLTIVERKAPWFGQSPFPMAPFRKQSVHYLVVRDPSGSTRRCWLAIGNVFFGSSETGVEVVWE